MPSKEYEKLSERMNELGKKLELNAADFQLIVALKAKVDKYEKVEKALAALKEVLGVPEPGLTEARGEQSSFDVNQSQVNINLKQLAPENIPADDKTLRGKIFSVMPEGKWFSTQDIFGAIKDKYAGEWNIDAPVSSELNTMVDAELLQKRKNTNRTVSYRLPDYIHIKRSE